MSGEKRVPWHAGRLVGADTETTGTDPHTCRIVTASVVYRIPGERPKTIEWLIDPEQEIPAEAAAVHGWTNDRLAQVLGGAGRAMRVQNDGNGEQRALMTRDAALNEFAMKIASAIHTEIPVVVANAPFDATLLDAELARNGIDPIANRPSGWRGIVDPQVIDQAYDQYRKHCYKTGPDGTPCDRENRVHVCGGCRGSKGYQCGGCGSTDRTLTSLCAHYGIPLTGAHTATADALAAVRLSVKLASLWPEIARWHLPTLHRHQIEWRRDQQLRLRKFFREIGKTDEADAMCPEWPVHVRCAPTQTAVA